MRREASPVGEITVMRSPSSKYASSAPIGKTTVLDSLALHVHVKIWEAGEFLAELSAAIEQGHIVP
jgi:hypothetical protein